MFARAWKRGTGIALAAILLGACTPSLAPPAVDEDDAAEDDAAEVVVLAEIAVEDAWVEATGGPTAGVFGVLHNASDQDLRVEGASSPLTERVELHETLTQGASPVMNETPDGFLIPAGGSYTLEPEGAHVMLMDLGEEIDAGADVEITIRLSSGELFTWEARAREY